MARPVAVLVVSALLVAACSNSSGDDNESAQPVDVLEVERAAAQGFDDVTRFHGTTDVALSAGAAEASVLRLEFWVDLESETARAELREPVEPGSDEFEVTWHWVLANGNEWSNTFDEGWEESSDGLAGLLFSVFETEADDLATALGEVVSAATGSWMRRTNSDAGAVLYESDDASTGVMLRVTFDEAARLVGLEQVKPPAGVDVEEARRGRETLKLDGFDDTEVELPDDLPD